MRFPIPFVLSVCCSFVLSVSACGDIAVKSFEPDGSGKNCVNAQECDDGLTCTVDTCVEGVCQYDPVPERCTIGGACYNAGDANPVDSCAVCQPSESNTGWTNACVGPTDDATDTAQQGDLPTDQPLGDRPDPVEADTDAGGPEPDQGGPAGCGIGLTCVPPAPAGWSGPVTLAIGPNADELSCVGNWPTVELTAQGELNVDEPNCSCSCGPVDNDVCTGQADLSIFDFGCSAPPTSLIKPVLQVDECESFSGWLAFAGDSLGYGLAPAQEALVYEPGTCEAQIDIDVEPTNFGYQAKICGGAQPEGSCGPGGAGNCLPAPPANSLDTLCVFTPGITTCPTVIYTQRRILSDSFTDDRACGCDCLTSEGACEASLEIYTTKNCDQDGKTEVVIDAGTCALAPGGHEAGMLKAVPQGACKASDPFFAGSVTTTGDVTVCCTPLGG